MCVCVSQATEVVFHREIFSSNESSEKMEKIRTKINKTNSSLRTLNQLSVSIVMQNQNILLLSKFY